jgi:hypothetical protein
MKAKGSRNPLLSPLELVRTTNENCETQVSEGAAANTGETELRENDESCGAFNANDRIQIARRRE